MNITDQITAAIEGRCACGCGAEITDASPSAYYATERCQARWQRQQRGEPEPPDPDDAPVSPTARPADPPPIAPGTFGSTLTRLFRKGWRIATPESPVPWVRRCHQCGQVATPLYGYRMPPATFDPAGMPAVAADVDSEPVNVCRHCRTPYPGPYMTPLCRDNATIDAYELLLGAADRYMVHHVSRDAIAYGLPDVLALAWRRVECALLRDLAPRCQHTSGCTEVARDRYELRAPILWEDRWHAPGSALLLCGHHGVEFQRHCWQRVDPVLGPMRDAYERKPLDWTRV